MIIKCPNLPGTPPFKIGKIYIENGQQIKENDVILSIEMKKGAKELKSSSSGIIKNVYITSGAEIFPNDILVEIEENNVIKKENSVNSSPSSVESCDICIIGGGPGGYISAIYAAQNKKNVILIEKNKLGGTCLTKGCMPTKSFIKSAEVYSQCKDSHIFGIESSNIKSHMDKIVERKNDVVSTLNQAIDYLVKKNNIKLISGSATFVDKNKLYVENFGEIIAENIIIATGSCSDYPPIPGIELPIVLNSTKALNLEKLPSSVTIIGGGVIGMEFAFFYRNLGVDVHIIEFFDQVLNMLDKDVSSEILRIANDKGIKISLSSKVTKIQESDSNKAVVTYEKDGKTFISVSDIVLSATGRVPNISGLNLEKINLTLNENKKGIAINDFMETNIKGIYAVGDVTNKMQLAHVASKQGIIAIDKILGKNNEIDYLKVPNVIFTEPEIASVGYTEKLCKKLNIDYDISKFYFSGNGKAFINNDTSGFVKLIINKTNNQLIGGAIIGCDASSLISTLTLGITNNLTVEQYTKTIFPHPTTSEAIQEAFIAFGLGSIHQ